MHKRERPEGPGSSSSSSSAPVAEGQSAAAAIGGGLTDSANHSDEEASRQKRRKTNRSPQPSEADSLASASQSQNVLAAQSLSSSSSSSMAALPQNELQQQQQQQESRGASSSLNANAPDGGGQRFVHRPLAPISTSSATLRSRRPGVPEPSDANMGTQRPERRSVFSQSNAPNGAAAPTNAQAPPGPSTQGPAGHPHNQAPGSVRRFSAAIRLPSVPVAPPEGGSGESDGEEEPDSNYVGSFLNTTVQLRSETARNNQTESRSEFNVPLWLFCTALFMVGFLAALYPYLIMDIDPQLIREMRTVTEKDIATAYRNLNTASVLQFGFNASVLKKHPWLQGLLQQLVRAHVRCVTRCYDVVAFALCPTPYPSGLFYHVLIHPFRSWVLSNSLLKSPRLTMLYLLFSSKFETGDLADSSGYAALKSSTFRLSL